MWAFLWSFLLLAFNYLLRPIRDAFAVEGATSDSVQLFRNTFLAMTVVVPTWSWLVSRYPRRILVPLAHRLILGCLIVFAFLTGVREELSAEVGRALFVWQAVVNVFLVAVFWSTLADLFREREGRTLYGLIAAGGTLGALTGSLLMSVWGKEVDVRVWLAVGVVLLEGCVLCMRQLVLAMHTWRTLDGETSVWGVGERPPASGVTEGLRALLRRPVLTAMAGYILVGTTLATFVYLLRLEIVKASGLATAEVRELFAQASLATQILALVFQATMAGFLLTRFGPGLLLGLVALAYLTGFVSYLSAPGLAVIIGVEILTRASEFGFGRPGREVVYTTVSRAEKYQAKSAIDNWVYRGGDLLGAYGFQLLFASGFLAVEITGLAGAGVGLGLAYWVGRAVERARTRDAHAR